MSYTEQQKESRRQAAQRWRERNPEKLREMRKALWRDNPDKVRKWSKNWQEIPANRATVLVRCRMFKARKKGIPYDEAALYEFAATPSLNCELCGVCFDFIHGAGKKQNGPSIDRIVNSLGYVRGNLAYLCNRCNQMKGHGTADDHRRIAEFIERAR